MFFKASSITDPACARSDVGAIESKNQDKKKDQAIVPGVKIIAGKSFQGQKADLRIPMNIGKWEFWTDLR